MATRRLLRRFAPLNDSGEDTHRFNLTGNRTRKAAGWPPLIASVSLFLALGLLVSAGALYLCQAAFVDHIESSVLIVGWQYLHGMPMYGIDSGAPHFATYYGPLAYLAPLPALLLFGPGVTSAKLIFVLAPLAAAALLAWHVWHR